MHNIYWHLKLSRVSVWAILNLLRSWQWCRLSIVTVWRECGRVGVAGRAAAVTAGGGGAALKVSHWNAD